MDVDRQEEVIQYLQNSVAQANLRADAYVYDENRRAQPTRSLYVKLRKYVDAYLDNESNPRWICLSGVRGVGKTTLLAQLYKATNLPIERKLYLSVDQATRSLNVSLADILEAYETILGRVFEQLNDPVILFLDEVQYEKDWAIILKGVYDRTKKVLVIATGSSALSLQTNPDVARRAVFETLYPMSFCEYMKIVHGKYEIKSLGKELRKIIFESSTAEEVHRGLLQVQPKVRRYWAGIDRLEIDRYLRYGTLPFAIGLKNEGLAYEQMKKTIDRVIDTDIRQMGNFSNEVITKIGAVLYAVAGSDSISLTKLAGILGLSKDSLSEVFQMLEKSETLFRVYPYGSPYTQVRKPSKYLFASPAFRSMYFNFIGQVQQGDNLKGRLLEDLAGVYIRRYLQMRPNPSMSYDSAQGGADLIVGFGHERIIMEIGWGAKGFRQVDNTAKRVSAKYKLSISQTSLKISDDKTSVNIPLAYFLLT